MEYKQKLIEYGYPETLMENWDDEFCEQEWKVLSQYLPQAIETTALPSETAAEKGRRFSNAKSNSL